MKTISFSRFAGACFIGFCLAGCRSGITPRTFVLTPIQTGAASARTGQTSLAIGIRPVKMPAYLSSRSFAVRRSPNEVVYPETLEWAERLDTSLQRVLAANLGALIPTDHVRLNSWEPGAVAVQVDINVERFDVDSNGEGVLTAWWQLISPDDEKANASGRFSAARKGPSPGDDPLGAAATMSSLAADLAGKLAQAMATGAGENKFHASETQ